MPTTAADERAQEMGEHRSRRLTTSERLLRMASAPFYDGINTDALVDVTRGQVEVHGRAGDVLWERGEPSRFNARIEYGRIRCENEHGKTSIITPVFVLGAMDTLAEIPRAYSAVAETDYISTNTPAHVFDAVIENHVDMGRKMQSGLAQMLLGE